MAHGLNSVLKRSPSGCKSEGKTGIGSRRIFAPHFKLQVLDSYRNDADCKGNQRATARKYGIHRRQIQKWLQVENNLRNSVKGKSSDLVLDNSSADQVNRKCGGIEMALVNSGHRQRDVDCCTDAYAQSEPRVPALPMSPGVYCDITWNHNNQVSCVTTPLDFSVSRVSGHASPIVANTPEPQHSPLASTTIIVDPASPIDLSLKKPTGLLFNATGALAAPVQLLQLSPPRNIQSPPSLAEPKVEPHPDVWDLSIKGPTQIKCETEPIMSVSPAPASISPGGSVSSTSSKPIKLFKPYLDDMHETSSTTIAEMDDHHVPMQQEISTHSPCCSSSVLMHPNCDSFYFNNNNVCEIETKYTFKSDYNNTTYTSSYTLHELQPKSYYYNIPNVYPSSDFELNQCCSTTNYDDNYCQGFAPLKQRQNYSLDFKLSAIDSYYQDTQCKGSQRAVANKYNIHRRQVQKWLKQAEELRQKNQSIKQIHAVR